MFKWNIQQKKRCFIYTAQKGQGHRKFCEIWDGKSYWKTMLTVFHLRENSNSDNEMLHLVRSEKALSASILQFYK